MTKASKRAQREAENAKANEKHDIDLGDGHWLDFTSWNPDRELNPQFAHLPDVEKFGALVGHFKPDGKTPCMASITFDGEVQRQIVRQWAMWNVKCWDPLHLEPSLKCSCGDHGFIRGGKWVRD